MVRYKISPQRVALLSGSWYGYLGHFNKGDFYRN